MSKYQQPIFLQETSFLDFTDTVTISSSQTVSTSVDLQGKVLGAIVMPSAFTGATVSFQASTDNSTFNTFRVGSSAFSVPANTDAYIALDEVVSFSFVRYLKIVSASSEAAERTITLVSRPLS